MRRGSRTWIGPIVALMLIAAFHFGRPRSHTTEIVLFDGCLAASPLLTRSARGERIVVSTSRGHVAAIDPRTRQLDWRMQLQGEWGEVVSLLATPAVVDAKLIVAYQTFSLRSRRRAGHHVAVIDLDTGKLDPAFRALELQAERPASDGSGAVRFNPPTALSRAAVAHGRSDPSSLGRAYVSFGNLQNLQPWHGWVFEIDLDAWKNEGPEHAISGVLLTTPETKCGVDGESGANASICGGGVWGPAGPQVFPTADGYELIVPTGNGQLDLGREDYAFALMRTGPGLRFDRACDESLCARYDPVHPSIACLDSCRNLFVPRPAVGDPPLRPPSGRCDGKTFWECLALMGYDLGAGSPARVDLAKAGGPTVLVQPGKDGAVYLVDAEHLGRMYQREQIAPICGSREFPCMLDWAGMIVGQPIVVEVGGDPVILIATFMPDHVHAAGVVALKLVVDDGTPHLVQVWQAPDPTSAEAVRDFRFPPNGIAVSIGASGRQTAWVAEGSNLWGFDIADGHVVERVPLDMRSIRYARPVVFERSLFVPLCRKDDGPGRLDVFPLPDAQ